jgi:hypothetical protein
VGNSYSNYANKADSNLSASSDEFQNDLNINLHSLVS